MAGYGLKEPRLFGGLGPVLLRVVPLLLLVGVGGAAGYLWVRSTVPIVSVIGGFPGALGLSTSFRVSWTNPHGVRRVTVFVEQNGARTVAYDAAHAARRFAFRPGEQAPGEASFSISRQEIPSLAPGRAVVVIEVQSNDLRGQVARLSRELPVVLSKPTVTADAALVYVRRGGTGAVAFTVGGQWGDAGVRVGETMFPSWPDSGHPERRISLFTVSPDAGTDAMPVLFARNETGTEVNAEFPYRLRAGKFRERPLAIGDGLMQKVLDELDAGGHGDPVERFTRINSDVRRANDATLAELARKSGAKRLWDGAFALPPGSKVLARFGDLRTYNYHGKTMNEERHLGLDMASVRNAPVPAANSGNVVFAGKLGIYGNCVVIDHGLGVLTVYGHMSEIAAAVGDAVSKGQEIGRTGMTGLAGGDHLHLGVMVGGVFVDPVEWEDPKWLANTVTSILAAME